jgi:hypothetical protein
MDAPTRDSPSVHHLPLYSVVVPDTLDGRIKRLSALQVQSDDVALLGLFLQSDDRILDVETTVGCERLRDDQQCLGESGHSELLSALGFRLGLFVQVLSACYLESSSAGDEGFVFDGVLDRSQTVPDGIGDLSDGMAVGSYVSLNDMKTSATPSRPGNHDKIAAHP